MPDGPLQARRRYPVHVAESDHHCHKRDLLCDWSVHLSGDPVQHARAGQRRERLHPGLRPVQWVRTAHSTAILHHTIDMSTAPPPHTHTHNHHHPIARKECLLTFWLCAQRGSFGSRSSCKVFCSSPLQSCAYFYGTFRDGTKCGDNGYCYDGTCTQPDLGTLSLVYSPCVFASDPANSARGGGGALFAHAGAGGSGPGHDVCPEQRRHGRYWWCHLGAHDWESHCPGLPERRPQAAHVRSSACGDVGPAPVVGLGAASL